MNAVIRRHASVDTFAHLFSPSCSGPAGRDGWSIERKS
jgi:hypothetical protein